MEAYRFVALFRSVVPYSLQRLIPFSSCSAASPRLSSFFSDDCDGGSPIYRHALKFQRPSTVKWREQFHNSVSFIGSVDRTLQTQARKDRRFCVYTLLNVQTSRESDRRLEPIAIRFNPASFLSRDFCLFSCKGKVDSKGWIVLQMWDKVAEISMKHLKPNDFIYVSGHLGSYTKADVNGKLIINYKVIVNELNYVARHGQGRTCQKFEKSESEGGGTALEKYKNRLHLWQVFFSNPYEWWDNRKGRVNSRRPDFTHKDTGEALWLNRNDPPWIKRQLQLHDSRLAERGKGEHVSSRSRLSTWVYDD